MKAQLKWELCDTGLEFILVDEAKNVIPIRKWGLYQATSNDKNATVSPLLSIVENETFKSCTDTHLVIGHPEIAKLDDEEINQIGLPPAAACRLEVRGQGLIASPSFQLSYQLLQHDARPIFNPRIKGAILSIGSKNYTLLDPLFSLVEGIQRYQNIPPQNMDERFIRWGELKPLLPGDAVVMDQLKRVNIVRADAFTLNIKDNDQFDPVLLTKTKIDESESAENVDFEPVLPEAHQRTFAKRFDQLTEAKQHYQLGGGWYVILSEKVQKSLQIVYQMKRKTATERRAFISNPYVYIKESIAEDNQPGVEEIFQETSEFLSERVTCLGEWNPKLYAYVIRTPRDWLPSEDIEINIPLGESLLNVTTKDIHNAVEKIKEAIEKSEPTVNINGQDIPANPETLKTMEKMEKLVLTKETGVTAEQASMSDNLVPILIDNLNELGYQAEQHSRTGTIGGLPANLRKVSLYEHQLKGINWMQEHWIKGSPGALLADDMGLGKTLQALTFLCWLKNSMDRGETPRKPILIVAPTGLLKNWEDEEKLHLVRPGLGIVMKAYGRSFSDFRTLSSIQRNERFNEVDWVLTTYETLRDKIKYFINVDWSVATFDEAQKIKNPLSRIAEMAKSLQADFTLMITGTPVENRLADLWSIIDTAHPGYLGSLKQFHDKYEIPALTDVSVASELKVLIQDAKQPSLMLRRMKDDHLKDLPKKHIHIVQEIMPAIQANSYQLTIGMGQSTSGGKGAMLKVLQQMRQDSLLGVPISEAGVNDEIVQSSARLKATIALLDKIEKENEKALIFLESLKLQELLIPYLQARYQLPTPPIQITGKVSGARRKQRVDEFQGNRPGEFDVMLLTPKAGGVGITLTSANHVIHLSRWWNPAVEDQCSDRVYRIGQKKDVNIYYIQAIHPTIRENSFDVKLHELLENKRDLSKHALMPVTQSTQQTSDFFNSVVN